MTEASSSWPGTLTPKRLGVGLLNLAASIHIAWFYVAYVPSELNLPQYEQGLERTPFQHRLLMMYPLRWAHNSASLNRLAHKFTAMPAWFPHGVHPEGIVEAAIDLACIVIAGLVARSLYEASSRTKLLGPYVYPLTLVMITATYCLNTMHRLRFVFDLPSMAFFAIGMYLLYFRRSALLFAMLFCIATVNRETTLFLLILLILSRWPSEPTLSWRTAFDLRLTASIALLGAFWLLWHRWVLYRFAANPTATGPRFWLNIGTLLWPTSWAQILCTFAFCLPLCMAGRNHVKDRTLHAWLWILPIWFIFMMRYGILIETRIFGELIPYVACIAALIAEERLLRQLCSAESILGTTSHKTQPSPSPKRISARSPAAPRLPQSHAPRSAPTLQSDKRC